MSNRKPSFVYEIGGESFANLIDGPRSFEDNLRRLVSLIGEPGRSTFSLSRLRDDQSVYDMTREELPPVFLQAAGTAEAMTIEWRRLDDDGEERLYTLGHGGPRHGEPRIRIDFNDGQNHTLVYPDEVFDATEAGDIFFTYFQTERVPDEYTLRPFDLDAPFEDQRGSGDEAR